MIEDDDEELEEEDAPLKPPFARKLVTSDEGVPAYAQHQRPCADCPFARASLPGWLGGMTPDEVLSYAYGEARMECHTLLGVECAGCATFRANVCKRPRDPYMLLLPADRQLCFASREEFLQHHRVVERGEDSSTVRDEEEI